MTGAQRWEWAFSGTPEAERVPYWMVVAPGLQGVPHSLLNFLVSVAEIGVPVGPAGERMHRDVNVVGDVALSRELTDEQVEGELARLASDGLAQRHTDAGGTAWCCASPLAVTALTESYANRRPMTTAHPNGGGSSP